MPVTAKAKEYAEKVAQWVQVDDCVNDRVKSEGVKYLPKPNPKDLSEENAARYAAYKQRALFMNVVKRTHDGFLGAIYRKSPVIELPTQTEYLKSSATLDGLSLTQLSKNLCSNGIKDGRAAILAEYPQAAEGLTAIQTKDLKAYLVGFDAKSVINWRYKNGKLVLVVIEICEEIEKDMFETEAVTVYLVLAIDESGRYYQQKYDEDSRPLTDAIYPKKSDGSFFEFIPFSFIGTVNNDAKIDPSLLYSISELNLGHYRNSADLEENCFIHGQLTLGITSDLPHDQFKTANPNGISVGSRAGHFLGASGGFHTIQADPNQLAEKLQLRKEEQMAAIGARLIEKTGKNETAEAVRAKSGADSASLSNLAHNVSEAIEKACDWCGLFMSATEPAKFELNQDFYPDSFTAQDVAAALMLFDRGRIAASDLHERLKQGGWIQDSRTLEEVEEEAQQTNPLM